MSQVLVLTAANCLPAELVQIVRFGQLDTVRLRFGVTDRNDQTAIIREVRGYYSSKYYTPDDFYSQAPTGLNLYDLAILRFSEPIIYANTIQPVKFHRRHFELDEGGYVHISGWGLEKRKDCETTLRFSAANFVNHSACSVIYNNVLKTHEICTDYDGLEEVDAYEANVSDLMTTTTGELVGIVTKDGSCGKTLEPVVFTNTSFFYNSKGMELIRMSEILARDYLLYQTSEINTTK